MAASFIYEGLALRGERFIFVQNLFSLASVDTLAALGLIWLNACVTMFLLIVV